MTPHSGNPKTLLKERAVVEEWFFLLPRIPPRESPGLARIPEEWRNYVKILYAKSHESQDVFHLRSTLVSRARGGAIPGCLAAKAGRISISRNPRGATGRCGWSGGNLAFAMEKSSATLLCRKRAGGAYLSLQRFCL